jgi:hypothetical protein
MTQTTVEVTLRQIREGRIAYSALSHASPDNPLGAPLAIAPSENTFRQARKGRTGSESKKRHNRGRAKVWKEKQGKGDAQGERFATSRVSGVPNAPSSYATTEDARRQEERRRPGIESSKSHKLARVQAWKEKQGKGAGGKTSSSRIVSVASGAPPSSAATEVPPRQDNRRRTGVESSKRHNRARAKACQEKQSSKGARSGRGR